LESGREKINGGDQAANDSELSKRASLRQPEAVPLLSHYEALGVGAHVALPLFARAHIKRHGGADGEVGGGGDDRAVDKGGEPAQNGSEDG